MKDLLQLVFSLIDRRIKKKFETLECLIDKNNKEFADLKALENQTKLEVMILYAEGEDFCISKNISNLMNIALTSSKHIKKNSNCIAHNEFISKKRRLIEEPAIHNKKVESGNKNALSFIKKSLPILLKKKKNINSQRILFENHNLSNLSVLQCYNYEHFNPKNKIGCFKSKKSNNVTNTT